MSRARCASASTAPLRVVPQATELRMDEDLVLRMGDLDHCRHPVGDWPGRPGYLLSADLSDLRLPRRAPPMQIVVVGSEAEIRFEHHTSDCAGANADYAVQGWRYRPTVQSQVLLGHKFVELLIVND